MHGVEASGAFLQETHNQVRLFQKTFKHLRAGRLTSCRYTVL